MCCIICINIDALTIPSAPAEGKTEEGRRGSEGEEEGGEASASPATPGPEFTLVDMAEREDGNRRRTEGAKDERGEGDVPSCDENGQSKPNVTPDVDDIERCILVLEE
jgi:hypothetical protein